MLMLASDVVKIASLQVDHRFPPTMRLSWFSVVKVNIFSLPTRPKQARAKRSRSTIALPTQYYGFDAFRRQPRSAKKNANKRHEATLALSERNERTNDPK